MGEMFRELKERDVIEGVTRTCAMAYGRAESAGKILPLVSGPEDSLGQIDLLGFSDRSYRIWTY
jgi:hypothetical protein